MPASSGLGMAEFSDIEPRTRNAWFRLAPWLVLAGSLVTTYFSYRHTADDISADLENEFDFQVEEITRQITGRIQNYQQVLLGVRGLFAVSHETAREEFKTYVNTLRLKENYPGIQGVGFAQIVPPGGLERHIEDVRREGFPGYTVRPPGVRDVVTSIVYLEPFDARNRRAFGYDMYSEPTRNAAMQRSRDIDMAVASGKVLLLQEFTHDTRAQAGFLLYLPAFRKGSMTRSLEERRANIFGWVYAPFRMDDLMAGLLGKSAGELRLEIFDGREIATAASMHDSHWNKQSPAEYVASFQTVKHFEIAGHPWTLRISSTPEFDVALNQNQVHVVVATGLTASLLLSSIMWLLVTGQARAYAMAQAMTVQLSEKEKLLQLAFDNFPGALTYVDENLNLVFCSSSFGKIYNLPPHLLESGRPYVDILTHLAKAGMYGDEGVESLVAERMISLRVPSELVFEDRPPDGKIYEIRRRRAGDGTVTSITDVTDSRLNAAQVAEKKRELETVLRFMSDGILLLDENRRVSLLNV